MKLQWGQLHMMLWHRLLYLPAHWLLYPVGPKMCMQRQLKKHWYNQHMPNHVQAMAI